MRLTRLVLGAAVAALAATAPAASAEPICAGTQEDLVVCVDREGVPRLDNGNPLITRCVVVPTESGCRTVTVPGVVLGGSGQRLVSCNGGGCVELVVSCNDLPQSLLRTLCRLS